jgi:hypothetical protein
VKKIILIIILSFFLHSQNFYANWVRLTGPLGCTVSSFAVNSPWIFAGVTGNTTYNGVYTSTNNGLSWVRSSLDTVSVLSLCSGAGASDVFAGVLESNDLPNIAVYHSINNGLTWVESLVDYDFIYSIYSLASHGGNIFAGDNGVIYSSYNNGLSWQKDTTEFAFTNTIFSLAISGSNIFAGTNGEGVYLSINNGMNWVQTNLDTERVYALTIKNLTTIFAGSDGYGGYGIYRSINNGSSWTQSLNNQRVFSLVNNGTIIIAGTDSAGVFVSTNDGLSWVQRNEGFQNVRFMPISSLLINGNDVYAGTGGFWIWKRSLTEFIGIKPISSEVPKDFSLSQNYPNPFNPSTNIKFEISNISPPFTGHPLGQGGQGGLTTLKIFDLLGREVANIVNEQLKPGSYEVTWEASNYSSGIYFYKLVAGDFVETKKMMLVK